MSKPSNSRTTRSDGATWMICGANGYTGLRLARQARTQGMRPVLAGRNPVTIKALADELDLPWVAFDLNDANGSQKALQGISVVAHCAGPYSATSAPMLDACIAAGATMSTCVARLMSWSRPRRAMPQPARPAS